MWLNALDLLDPSGGCAGGAADTDPDEVGTPKGALVGVLAGLGGVQGGLGEPWRSWRDVEISWGGS